MDDQDKVQSCRFCMDPARWRVLWEETEHLKPGDFLVCHHHADLLDAAAELLGAEPGATLGRERAF